MVRRPHRQNVTDRLLKSSFLIIICLVVTLSVFAQDKPEKEKKSNRHLFRDSLDGKLDLSRFLVEVHGFILVPQLITEPALGNFGILLTPVFIHPNKAEASDKYIPPDITVGFMGYTANKSRGFGALRIASLPKVHLKYRVGAADGDANLDLYRQFPGVGEYAFDFNFNSVALFGSLLREIGESDLY